MQYDLINDNKQYNKILLLYFKIFEGEYLFNNKGLFWGYFQQCLKFFKERFRGTFE